MTDFEMYDQALRKWELRIKRFTNGYFRLVPSCAFCKKYLRYDVNDNSRCSPKCPLAKYGYECEEDGDPYSEYVNSESLWQNVEIDKRLEASQNMHMVIHLISSSEGYEIY